MQPGSMEFKHQRLGYRSDIQGLRAIAIILVVGAHAAVPCFGGGFVGVDVFFVLSGFLITGLLVRELNSTGSIGFTDFYARRFRRLLPALLVMLVFTSLLAAVLLPPAEQPSQAKAATSAAMGFSNFYFVFSNLDYFGADAVGNLFLHTWSLGVEEQFYLFWPALLLLLGSGRWWKASLKGTSIVMLAIALISLLSCVLLTEVWPRYSFYLMPPRMWQFALGAITSLSVPHGGAASESLTRFGRSLPVSTVRFCGWVGLGLILAANLSFSSSTLYPDVAAVLPSAGAAIILGAGSLAPNTGVARVLSWRPFQAIGSISYSWYLWHWPVMVLGGVISTLADPLYRVALVTISFIFATVSYLLVERPIRRNVRLIERPRALVLKAIALMLIVAVSASVWLREVSNWMDQPQQRRYLSARFDWPVIGACDDYYKSADVRICEYGPKNAKYTAAMIGDSIGTQWFPAVAAIFEKPDWRLLVLTKSSCPMVDVPIFNDQIGRPFDVCDQWRGKALTRLAALKPDVVLLGSSSSYPFDQEQWREGTARVLAVLHKEASRIYLLRATPHLPFRGPACLSSRTWLPALAPLKECHASAFDQHDADVYRWLQEIAQQFDNVTTVDMNDIVCPNGECEAERKGEIVFRDQQHLTAKFVKSISGDLQKKLSATN